MIQEQYVSFEVAKLLKDKGFKEPCIAYWFAMTGADPILNENMPRGYYNNEGNNIDIINCPTQQMAMRWLREVHNIKVNVFYSNPNYAIEYFELNTQTGVDKSVFIGEGYHVYEEAVEAAIKYCLEHLI